MKRTILQAKPGLWSALVVVTALALAGCPEPEERPTPELPVTRLQGPVVPDHGPERGSTRVRVSGEDINPLARLVLGGREAGDVQVARDGTWIEGLTPAGEGAVDVAVLAPGGQREVLEAAFRYDPGPLVEGLDPAEGPRAGGTAVAVTGRWFSPGARVTLGGEEVNHLEVTSDERLTFVTPRGRGTADLRVVNPDGQSVTLADAFSYVDAPRIVAVTPSTGAEEGGTQVVITGSGFRRGAQVWLGDQAVADPEVEPPARVSFRSPAGTGLVGLRLRNDDGQEALLEQAFQYLAAPRVTAVEPPVGPEVGGNAVVVHGTGFLEGTTRIYFGTAGLRDPVVDAEAGTVTGVAPPGEGTVAVHAENLDVRGPDLAEGYRYVPPPEPRTVEPSQGAVAGGYAVTVFGGGFQEGARVLLGGQESPLVDFLGAGTLSVEVPPGAPGTVDLRVTNPDGQSGTLQGAFSYVPAPALQTIEPAEGCASGGTEVRLTGANFDEEAEVLFGEDPAEIVEHGPGLLVVRTPAGEGAVDVVVANPDGQQALLADGFEFSRRPQVYSIEPGHGPLAGGVEVELSGDCLLGGETVTFGGEEAEIVGREGQSLLRLRTPEVAQEGPVAVQAWVDPEEVGELDPGYIYHDAVYDSEVEELNVRGALAGLTADLDGDGQLEVLLTGSGVSLWRQEPDLDEPLEGPFAAFRAPGHTVVAVAPLPAAAGEPSSLAVVTEGEPGDPGGLAVLPPAEPGSWLTLTDERYLTHDALFCLAAGDVTGDGHPDLVAGGVGGAQLFVGDAHGEFARVEDWAGLRGTGVVLALTMADLTGDGVPDLFFGVTGGPNVLLRGTGRGGFVDESVLRLPLTESATQAVLPVDLDADGDLDLILGEQGRDLMWRNDDGFFADTGVEVLAAPEESTVGLLAVDLDGDGWLDIVVSAGPGSELSHRAYRNVAGVGLEDLTETWLPVRPQPPGVVALTLPGPFGISDLVLVGSGAGKRLRDTY